VLAITKCDLIDDELKKQLKNGLPKIPAVFISSHHQTGLTELKDLLWKHLQASI
jgi:GTPase